ncbi:glycosyltransferase family 4 protein [Pseudomonas juntendi]|uniref:Glycosyltransferase n=1 Tax=Pseudomonas juntendi TaxID=2666183 RepID=A0AAJ5S4C4_9PSED|nr:glycosyltransferase [Pseudomonas juntendi]QOH70753.1 glycosyltransferase [Pseudomonas putida]WEA21855.1 glycosyltransferase [Pseudomonas juntendi]
MHLIICNERLLFRFGVDRVLLLLAQGLKASGWHITFVAQRANHDVLRRITDDIHTPPEHLGAYTDLDQVTAEWLRDNRHLFSPAGSDPSGTVALIGGWPFYASIAVFRQWGVPTVALDCGGVPYEDMKGPARMVQERLRAQRREYLPEARVVTPISHFVSRSQSLPDAGPEVEIAMIHLGADHLAGGVDQSLWLHGHQVAGDQAGADPADGPMIINLGRWETGNYKNSEGLYPIARQIIAVHPKARFSVLATADELKLPADLVGYILPLGHPSDAELSALMANAQLGLSVSHWEGFNLPLAEMQQLRKPVLVLNIGAHPEVVADARQLCADEHDMAAKALRVLAGDLLTGPEWEANLDNFQQTFTWKRTIKAYADLLATLNPIQELPVPKLVIDTSACLRDTANTGVARVVRSLTRKLQDFGEPLFVTWDETLREYVLPTEGEYHNLALYGGPKPDPQHYVLPRSPAHRRQTLSSLGGRALRGGWLLQSEIVFERQGPARRAAARQLGLNVAAIFYDAIPVTHPEWVADTAIRDNHAAYMRGLAETDRVLPISPDAGKQLQAFWEREGINPHAHVKTCWIPGELTASVRATTPAAAPDAGEPLRILCVSTLEPRKNHKVLLEAVSRLARDYPQLDWQLDLIGNRYAGADHIVDAVRAANAADPRIVWHGVVDDATLNDYYAKAHVSVYASLVEGYGMPIVESLWHARPCICHNGGVMAELAAEGGCRTVDMTDPDALARQIYALASEPQAYLKLASEAVARPILTWRSYARAMLRQLASHTLRTVAKPLPRQWQHLLIDPQLQLVDEPGQLALACLLHQRPAQCALLLGEHPQWVTDLIGHHALRAWQVADGTLLGDVSRQGAISRIEAPVDAALPLLLAELRDNEITVDLVVLAAEPYNPALREALSPLLTGQAEGLLLIAQGLSAETTLALGLPPEAAIELPGLRGYHYPLVKPGADK